MADYISSVKIDGTDVSIKDKETSDKLNNHINANNPHNIQVGGRNLYYLKDFSHVGKNNISDYSVKSGEITLTASGTDVYFGNVVYSAHDDYQRILGPLMYVEGASFLTISISNSDFNKNFYNFFDKDKKALAGPHGPVDRITTLSVPSDAVYFTLRVGNGHAVAGTTYKTRLKVERGNIPTDWTPALEDLETSVTLDKVYPVGSIYMSVNDVDPKTLFGGTWIRIQGKFLLGFSTFDDKALGSTGGEAQHLLTTNEMPTHTHGAHFYTANTETSGDYGLSPGGGFGGRPLVYDNGDNPSYPYLYIEGGSEPHNNMPPYLVVNMWKRTA